MGAMLPSRLPSLHFHRTWIPEADITIDEPQPNLLSSPLCFPGMNGDETIGTTGLEG